MTSQPDRFHLRIRAAPGSIPPIIRLRRLLKILLRGYGFVCEEIRELPVAGEFLPIRGDKTVQSVSEVKLTGDRVLETK